MRTALVTGSSRGIGREIALELGKTHHVVAVGRDRTGLESLVAEIPSGEALALDLASADLSAGLACVDTGELDFLVHAAAVGEEGRIDELARETWRRSFELNLFAVADLTKQLLPDVRRNRGTVVLLNSGSGMMSYSGGLPYSATKHALRDFADCLREEERANGVRVTSLYPGWVDTDMGRDMRSARSGEFTTDDFVPVAAFGPIIRTLVELPPAATIQDLVLRPTYPDPTATGT